MAITGTTISLKRDMRCMPPHITASVPTVIMAPNHAGFQPNDTAAAAVIVLACTELKASPKVMVMSTAKVTAHHLHPMPLSM